MKKSNVARVVYCGPEDSYFKKLSRYCDGYFLEAKSTNFAGSPQKFARSRKASVLVLKIRNEFELKHQEWLSRHDASVPLLIIAQNGTIETAIHVLQYGVFDYFCASENPGKISRRIREAVDWRATKVLKKPGPLRSELLLGEDSRILEINERARKLAQEKLPLLLYGETGTGKEHLAYGMYRLSCGKNEPFLSYDCRLLQHISKYDGVSVPSLIGMGLQEVRKHHNRGILFLSHVEQLPAEQQGDIFDRSSLSPIKVIASYQEPSQTLFEQQAAEPPETIRIPALRQRPDDIPLISEHFVYRISKNRKIPLKAISNSILRIMQDYHWPGNIQELFNIVERMMSIEPSGILTPETWKLCQGYSFPLTFDRTNQYSNLIEDVLKEAEVARKGGALYEQFMERMKRMLIDQVLPKVDYNQATAAKILGISRNTLREKLRA
jgi:DNA-binding NtrC family response regulator